jgi:hypothetical protein
MNETANDNESVCAAAYFGRCVSDARPYASPPQEKVFTLRDWVEMVMPALERLVEEAPKS